MKSLQSLHLTWILFFCLIGGHRAEFTSFDNKLEQFQNQLEINQVKYAKSLKHLKDLQLSQPQTEQQTNIAAMEKITDNLTHYSNQVNKIVLQLKEHRTKKQEIQEKIKLHEQADEYRLALEGLIRSISEVDMDDEQAKQKIKGLIKNYFERLFPGDQWTKISFRFLVHSLSQRLGTMEQLKASSNKWIGPLFQKLAQHPEFLEKFKSVLSDIKGINPMLKHVEVDNLAQLEAIARMFLTQTFEQFSTTDELEQMVSETIDHYSQQYIGAKVMETNLKSLFDNYYILLTFVDKKQWEDIIAQINSFHTKYGGGVLAELKKESKDTKEHIKKIKEELVVIIDENLEKMDKDLKLANSFEGVQNGGKEKLEL